MWPTAMPIAMAASSCPVSYASSGIGLFIQPVLVSHHFIRQLYLYSDSLNSHFFMHTISTDQLEPALMFPASLGSLAATTIGGACH